MSKDKSSKLNTLLQSKLDRPVVLLGMMGAGKSRLGKKLAEQLNLPFHDADHEIEAAADMTIPEIFEKHGEAAFRDGEKRVIARLLDNGPQILALGGGAFTNEETRAEIHKKGISVWLDVELDELVERVNRKPGKRPLLAGVDAKAKLSELLAERGPVYAQADIRATLSRADHSKAVKQIKQCLKDYLMAQDNQAES